LRVFFVELLNSQAHFFGLQQTRANLSQYIIVQVIHRANDVLRELAFHQRGRFNARPLVVDITLVADKRMRAAFSLQVNSSSDVPSLTVETPTVMTMPSSDGSVRTINKCRCLIARLVSFEVGAR